MSRYAALFGLAMLVASPASLASQARGFELRPGERIEIAAPVPDGALVRATVLHWEPSWTSFRLEDGQVWTRHMYAVDQVRVQRSVPLGTRLRTGAAWGVFLGTSLGGMAAPFAAKGMSADLSDWQAVGVSAAAGGVLGMSLGSLLGTVISRSSWNHYRFLAAPVAEP